MVYVGAMQDSFPHALELSKKGYNAFALIYRPGAQTACEDLARAIAFLHEHTDELQIDMSDYSLWGGSAGARMVAWLGSYGTAAFGEKQYPQSAAVIMQYTGLSDVTEMSLRPTIVSERRTASSAIGPWQAEFKKSGETARTPRSMCLRGFPMDLDLGKEPLPRDGSTMQSHSGNVR